MWPKHNAFRSHLERGPAEFVELKIWADSESSTGFEGALCDSHIQIGRLAYTFRTEVGPSPSELWRIPASRRPNAIPICRISDWHRAVNAISSTGHTGPGWMHVLWESSGEVASLSRTRSTGWEELPERCKIAGKARSSLTPPESATRSERFLNFDRGPTGPRTSLQIPRGIFFVFS